MPFEPLIKEEPAPQEPTPDPMAAVNAQLAAIQQQMVNSAYQQQKGIAPPQVQYVPYPVQQAQPEPQMTEADMLANLPESVQAVAQRIAAEREQALREEMGLHIGTLYERDFERNLRDLSQHPYYRYAQTELEAHFQQNPQERYVPGRLREKYDQILGAKVAEISSAEEVQKMRAVDVAVPVSTSPVPSRKAQKDIQLDPVREELRQVYNRQMGLNMSAREWVEIETGRALGGTKWGDDLAPLPEVE